MIGLLLLKHIYGLSDEDVCKRWVYDPYFQYFIGEDLFQHAFPHERCDLSHWRKRLGERLELLLAESLRVAHDSGALRIRDIERVTVDTTVQPKNVTFPTDAKLVHAANKAQPPSASARPPVVPVLSAVGQAGGDDGRPLRPCHTVQLPPSRAAFPAHSLGSADPRCPPQDQGPRTTSKQPSRTPSREPPRPFPAAAPARLEAPFLYAPEVECIGKGKACSPYEFGVKASIVATNRCAPAGQFVLHAMAPPGNPYDGHTLRDAIDGAQRLTGCQIERVYVDKGFRGHDAPNPRRVFNLRAEARRVRRHQTRAQASLRHRTSHRPHQGRGPPRPLLSQGP
jgi:IS5 family transposase